MSASNVTTVYLTACWTNKSINVSDVSESITNTLGVKIVVTFLYHSFTAHCVRAVSRGAQRKEDCLLPLQMQAV